MARILCVDTDPDTAKALMAAGHEVFAGTLGYMDGQPRLAMPPHEVDLLVCDLRTPACFDSNWWGPGRNDNYHCKIVPNPLVQWRQSDHGVLARYQIIQTGQMGTAPPGSFGARDIHRAISTAGVPLFLMLNPEWLNHTGYYSPDFAGVRWRFNLTRAERVQINEPLVSTFPEVEQQHRFVRPLQFEIVEGADAIIGADMHVSRVVTNAVGQQFGQVIQMGEGEIWALPKMEDNSSFLALAASRIAAPRAAAVEARPSMAANGERDVFISHASEDKDAIARPLARALTEQGATVWFDEYELRLGDRLRAKIEEGLRRSRFGAVILSHSFFAKRWPQLELDGLFALEAESKRILPVWHGVSVQDVAVQLEDVPVHGVHLAGHVVLGPVGPAADRRRHRGPRDRAARHR